ncbi:DNA polymerase III subunit gamma/tau [Deferribacter autotrophicus]|uniref:DNA polymerase III subunit gamma/tau n=1 Tax=Deferribacter autotrophicus TaxID=500465 RepID=A0A5A8F750_9BACT|nr:DNA polymerase III subunit gamma/tau [Deferribacter autotrophicus]KAA0258788.1 DNA polymerase III subunit gamma/tau [Deferribacter autotrophicus]
MGYVALARKYRPQTFDEVVFQDYIVNTLKNAIELNRISHAYLFTGPRGIGKTSTARIFAKALNCLNPQGVNPCNSCENCKEITEGVSLDVFEIDGASNRGIDEIRQLRESVKFLPAKSKYKIYIIDEVHMLTEAAFNALLKTLEEPPDFVIFILATTDAHRIPATILSRCQRFNFSKIPFDEMFSHTSNILRKEGITFEDDALSLIIRNSDGCMRDCLSLIDQIIAYTNGEITLEKTKFLLGLSEDKIINELYKSILTNDKNRTKSLLDEISLKGIDYKYISEKFLHYTKLLLLMHTFENPAKKELTTEEVSFFSDLLQNTSEEKLFAIYQTLLKVYNDLKYFSFEQDIFEMGIFKILHIDRIIPSSKLTKNTPTKIAKENIDNPSKPTLSLDNIEQKWKKFLDFIAERKPSVSSNLGYGYLISIENNKMIVGFAEEKMFHYKIVIKAENIDFLKRAAKKYFGNVDDIIIKLENGSKKKGVIEKVNEIETFKEKMLKKELKENKAVELLLKEFDGKIVDIEIKK